MSGALGNTTPGRLNLGSLAGTSLQPRIGSSVGIFSSDSRGRGMQRLGLALSMSGGAKKLSVEDVLRSPKWPDKWPFSDADFKRME